MKKYLFIWLILPLPLMAQFNITPFVGMNSTRLSEEYSGYAKGGNFAILGVELEKTFALKQYSPFSLSLTSGLSYLPNGFNRENSLPILNGYVYSKTTIETTYWQVPVILRLNWRPFALVEDWRVFIGGGISYNILTQAHISEQAMGASVAISYYPPISYSYQDSRDVTDMAVKNSIFQRFEVGMKFKHIQVTWRISVSTQDMYFKGLEKNWQVPTKDSFYLNTHASRGITNEKYSEVVLGWRF